MAVDTRPEGLLLEDVRSASATIGWKGKEHVLSLYFRDDDNRQYGVSLSLADAAPALHVAMELRRLSDQILSHLEKEAGK